MFYVSTQTETTTSTEQLSVTDKLAQGFYRIGYNDRKGYFLTHQEPYTSNTKVYGDLDDKRVMIEEAFKSREHSTGVLMSGQRGSGKTLLTRLTSISLSKQGYPVIEVPHYMVCNDSCEFIGTINTPCVVIFDEIDKINEDCRDALLPLLDGIRNNKALFLLSANNVKNVSVNLFNRPSRIWYHFRFPTMDCARIAEYCRDNGCSEEQIQAIQDISDMSSEMSIDLLAALVTECKRTGKDPKQVCRYLNIDVCSSYILTVSKIVHKKTGLQFTTEYPSIHISRGDFIKHAFVDQRTFTEDISVKCELLKATKNDYNKYSSLFATRELFEFWLNSGDREIIRHLYIYPFAPDYHSDGLFYFTDSTGEFEITCVKTSYEYAEYMSTAW